MPLRHVPLSQLTLLGERAFRSIPVYAALKRMLLADGFTVRVPEAAQASRDRVLFLNLTYWNARDPSDVLVDDTLEADVLAHAAWHHAARKALPGAPTAAAMLLGESVASAFDLYVVGQMLRQGKRTAYLKSQIPRMSSAALDAGVDEDTFAELLAQLADDPDGAFADLRALLFDASLALLAAPDLDAAAAALEGYADHRFHGLLHHYELSNWVLFARAYAAPAREDDPAIAHERAMRAAPALLPWLEEHWLAA
jgi:hypothetical protein